MKALLSVYDKTGLPEFAAVLSRCGFELVSTGGTAAAISGAGLPVQEVADKIYECATEKTPVHNPVGRDAQMLMALMGGPGRQAFIDQVEPMLIPQS